MIGPFFTFDSDRDGSSIPDMEDHDADVGIVLPVSLTTVSALEHHTVLVGIWFLSRNSSLESFIVVNFFIA